ncbi:MAG: glutaredoxin [Planctomycetota bacterium]
MVVHVYGQAGCDFCRRAKDKIQLLGFDYEEHDLQQVIQFHEGWREDGSIEVLAAHSEINTLPLIRVGEKFMDYTAAMKELKQLRRACRERVGA